MTSKTKKDRPGTPGPIDSVSEALHPQGVTARIEILLLEGGGHRARVALPVSRTTGSVASPDDPLMTMQECDKRQPELSTLAINALLNTALELVHGTPGAELDAFVAMFSAPGAKDRNSITTLATGKSATPQERLVALTKLVMRVEAARDSVADEISEKNLKNIVRNTPVH